MVRCTKEDALETRSSILDAAVDVFHSHGVSQTSLADIATAAGVTRGAIYWHFKNKSDLFDAMCERVRLPLEAMIESSADENAQDPLGHFRSWCLHALQEALHNPLSRKVFEIVMHKCEFVDPQDPILIRQRECFLQGRQNIERVLRLAVVKEQLPRKLDPAMAAIMVHAMLFGVLDHWLFSPDSFDLETQSGRVVDTCIHMLQTAPSLQKE
ncbi:TetR family transcriptional regulator [Paraherbaspirillum soli]|uniref:TetR family transcriptional regulator n=1 Tax=Paraherbaspirillum soli TaxID=631222 RepID=A0ABW0MD37_9BURK